MTQHSAIIAFTVLALANQVAPPSPTDSVSSSSTSTSASSAPIRGSAKDDPMDPRTAAANVREASEPSSRVDNRVHMRAENRVPARTQSSQ
jgi:hypothetical protein